jgi:hypothetical protein
MADMYERREGGVALADDATPGGRDARIIQAAKDCVRRAEEATSAERKAAAEDQRYLAGEQWPDQIRTEREGQQRPCLVLNKTLVKYAQITNDYAQNPIGVEVQPASESGTSAMATILDGMLRYNVYGSRGQSSDTVAFNHAVAIGRGYVRLRTEYVSDTSFAQRIVLDAVENPLNVYFDAHSTALDGSDATECVYVDDMRRDDFTRQYPEAEATATRYIGDPGIATGWLSDDTVRVAEYYCCEYEADRLLQLTTGQAVLESQLQDPQLAALAMQVGFTPEQRDVQRRTVKWYKLTAVDVLEERTLPGAWIPVVPFYGQVLMKDGERTCFGVVRPLRDPQAIMNHAWTTNVELVAGQPRAPWVGPEGFMAGYERDWQNSNNSNIVALQYRREGLDGMPITEAPQRIPFPAPPLALVQMQEAADRFIDEISGIGQPEQPTPGSPRSAKSFRETDSQASMGTYHYFAHARLSMLQAHRIMLAWIPVYHRGPDIVQVLGLDGQEALAPINQKALLQGVQQVVNDVTAGEYRVRLATGPAYETQRAEAADKLVAVGAAYPELWAKAGSDIIRTFNVPGGDKIAQKLAVTEPQVPDLPGDPQVALAQSQQQLKDLQQQAQALNALAEQLEQQAKDLTEQNRELRLGLATLQAQRQGDQAEAGVRQRQDALKLQEEQWASQQKELQWSARITQLQAQLATQQYKTAVAQNGSNEE